ncbi:AraC family transcriptional regulator [Algicella marina]|uniref:Helix-turn-helix domain-containing protein n=1 Tax=Algicella marina TaxID=2683284 RepID=A0A6P1T1D3_9RHOB|nr:helix-turn-helix domain-containing protein [Algicella marina]QHQ34342.1 helix-turn-helix domain-containing protein [Algicella marina]
MMDKTEHSPFALMPVHALSLRLARTTIRMQHAPTWRINKLNPTHDLLICLTGSGHYEIGDDRVTLSPGESMLIPAYQRFRGRHGGGDAPYTGVAQHFTLDLFGRGDIIGQMQLRRKVTLRPWDVLAPLVHHYRNASSPSVTTPAQHHQFMVLLLAFLEEAFEGWRTDRTDTQSQDQLSLQIMLVASRLSADPLGEGAVEEAMSSVLYNPDYFRRAFRDRIGMTPQKYREFKRMEFAVHRLGMGLSVKEVAAELGYSDPYFFSRMFKRHIGASPSNYRERRTATPKFEYRE